MNTAQFCKGEGGVKAFGEKLQPFRDTLQEYQFLGGASPCYADICLLSFFLVRSSVFCLSVCRHVYLQMPDTAVPGEFSGAGCHPSLCKSPELGLALLLVEVA